MPCCYVPRAISTIFLHVGAVDEIVSPGNARNANRIDRERMALKKLPVRKTADYEK